MKIRLFLFFVFVGIMIGNAQHITMKNYQRKALPTSLVQISQGVYSDHNPITNIDWREYLYWIEKVYGKESDEYLTALPDEQIVRQQLPDSIANYYLKHPAYSHFPVLGIAPTQALAYCRWRTDRVAEVMFIRMKLLKKSRDSSLQKYFSIKNQEIPKDLKILYFFLPTENTETRYGFGCFAEWR